MEYFRPFILFIVVLAITACGGGGSDSTNSNPTVNAGPDQVVTENDSVRLNGVFNVAGGTVTLSWTQTLGTAVTLSSTAVANPVFTAPMVSANESLEFTLTVTDGNGVNIADTVIITVNDSADNNSPIVDAGLDQSKAEGTTVQLSGSGSDPDGPVTFSWTQASGTSVDLSDASIVNPTFVAPMVSGTEVLVFTLTVTDSAMVSMMDNVTITITDTVIGGSGTPAYLFYTKGLNAVDPDSPASPTEVVPEANLATAPFGFGFTAESFLVGTYDSAAQTISDLHTYAIIYAHTDGNFYKVSALKSGSLAPVRVSSESMADQLCEERNDSSTADLANPDNSQLIYTLPGADSLCNTSDDVWKMVRLSMSATDAPIMAKPTVDNISDQTTGAITGWLVHDTVANELQRCDASFAGCSAITPVTISVGQLSRVANNLVLLEIDNQLFVYDAVANTLSSSIFAIPAGTYLEDEASDGSTSYFVHGSSIYQFPADGSAMATVLATEGDDIQRIQLNDNNIVYQLSSSGQNVEIKSVPKAGGTPISLVTATGTDNVSMLIAKNNRVYYNIQNTMLTGSIFTTVPVAAGVIDDDGMNQVEIMTAAWNGFIYNTTMNLGSSSIGDLVDKVILAEGYDIAGTSGGYAGATLKSVDAATFVDIATLGTLPTTDHLPGFFCYGFGDDSLCTASIILDPAPTPPARPTQSDIFYLNASTANSLERVTNTANKSERPVGG